MMHSRKLDNRINKVDKRALRLVYRDNKATFDEILGIEIFKVRNDLTADIIKEIFLVSNFSFKILTKQLTTD